MVKLFNILFLVFLVQNVFGQYQNLSFNEFEHLEKLDLTISLDDNFDFDLLHYAILHYTNKHRINKRKKPLSYSKTLENSAALHSYQMRKYNFFAHINKKERKFRDLDDRAKFAGYQNFQELAENLYYGFIDIQDLPSYRTMAKTIVQALIDSKSHNLNLINKDLKEMGTYVVFKKESENGFLYYYVTQSFGTQFR